jgi:trigger factor
MNVTTEVITATRKKLTVSLTADEVSAEQKKLYSEFLRHAKIPGFRPGKAPLDLIKRRFKKEMEEDLTRRLVGAAYDGGLKKSEDNIFAVVEVSEPAVSEAQSETLIGFTVDIFPEFELPEYKGIATEVPSNEVSDEAVEKAILELRQRRGEFKKVERPAQKGDYAKVSYTGKIDGQLISELVKDAPIWGTQENTWEEVAAEKEMRVGVSAVIEALEGMTINEAKTVEMTFADDHEIEALRGKTAQYELTLSEVRERTLPEIDEAFLKALKVDSVEALKDRVLDDLQRRKDAEINADKRRQISDHLLGAVEFELPESAVEKETEVVMTRIMRENMDRGVPEEQFEANKEAFHASSREAAMREIRLDVILTNIAKKESIALTDQDMEMAIRYHAYHARIEPNELVAELRKNRDLLQTMRQRVLASKTLDFLAEQASVSVKAVS